MITTISNWQDFYRGEFPDTQVMKPLLRKTLHKSRREVYSKIKVGNKRHLCRAN